MSDLLFPSDNEYGIPVLEKQPLQLGVPQPVIVWGSTSRSIKNAGTLAYYTDDYRFEALWRRPEAALETGAGAAVECNFTITDSSPLAVVIWQTYRKRYLARFWQNAGISIYVDLCVPPHFQHINLLGVPRTWGQYATAAWDSRLADLELELKVAKSHAAGFPYSVIVYGGGKKVGTECARLQALGHPIIRVAHRSDARKKIGQWNREHSTTEIEENQS